MPSLKTSPYGAWKSPITAELIAAATLRLSEVRIFGEDVYWLEGRPQEAGRNVVVRSPVGGAAAVDLVPLPYNARTRVHEYGGGAWLVADGFVYFSNFADGRLYRQAAGAAAVPPVPLTPAPSVPGRDWRFGDGLIDGLRQRWVGVREDHTAEGLPVNTIVGIDLARPGTGPGRIIVDGHDFFSSPRLSPDGGRLMWLAWDLPNMPWIGTTLYVGELGQDGGLVGTPRVIAGGASESIFQPEWSPDGGSIFFVSDRSGWWNLYRYDTASGSSRVLAPRAAEFGQPQWMLGMSLYAFAGPERIVCTCVERGLAGLAVLDLPTGTLTAIETPYTDIASVRADAQRVVFCGAAPTIPASIVELSLDTRQHRVLKKSTDILDRTDLHIAGHLTAVRPIEFPTTDGETAFGLFYPPQNVDHAGPAGEKPPLVVKSHGGPTSAASSAFNLGIQFWTSRGIAVLDVNYRGSSGFGRVYRDRLYGNWGIVDVDDCINGAKFLARENLIDEKRAVITGGSAGGYTTLAALVFRDFFAGGASHYGVSDASALARDTHKFESRYLDWLIGPYPQEEARYRERSPIHHAGRLKKPVIFFQGDEDAIVPPNQTEMMVEAVRRNATPVGYFLFSGEQHGFRKAGNIQRSLEAELYFYAVEVFKTGLTF